MAPAEGLSSASLCHSLVLVKLDWAIKLNGMSRHEIVFLDGIEITFLDDYERGNFTKSKMRIVQYHEKGRAVHITLNERQVEHLFKKLSELQIESQ